MKQELFLIFIMVATVVVAGCTSQDNSNGTGEIFNTGSGEGYVGNNSTNSNLQNASNSSYEAGGLCTYVVDGDTIDVEGVGRIRFVGVNTPERGEEGYQSAKDFVKSKVLDKQVYLDIDDKKHYDKYGRVLAVVYIDGANLNQELLKQGYAEVMYIPPSEFSPYSWT